MKFQIERSTLYCYTKVLAALLAFMLAISLKGYAYAADEDVGIAIDLEVGSYDYDNSYSFSDIESEETIKEREEFNYGIVVQNVENLDTISGEIYYNSQKVEFIKADWDDFSNDQPNFMTKLGGQILSPEVKEVSPGRIVFGASLIGNDQSEAVSGTGMILEITMKALQVDQASLVLHNCRLRDSVQKDIPLQSTSNSLVKIEENNLTPEETATPLPEGLPQTGMQIKQILWPIFLFALSFSFFYHGFSFKGKKNNSLSWHKGIGSGKNLLLMSILFGALTAVMIWRLKEGSGIAKKVFAAETTVTSTATATYTVTETLVLSETPTFTPTVTATNVFSSTSTLTPILEPSETPTVEGGISGKVYEGSFSQGVVDVIVIIYRVEEDGVLQVASTETDVNGNYYISELPKGEYKIQFVHEQLPNPTYYNGVFSIEAAPIVAVYSSLEYGGNNLDIDALSTATATNTPLGSATVIESGTATPTLTSMATNTPEIGGKQADFDGNGNVYIEDLAVLADHFYLGEKEDEWDEGYDLNKDGKIGWEDYDLFKEYWLAGF